MKEIISRLGIKEPGNAPYTVWTGKRNRDGSPLVSSRQPADNHTYFEALKILADLSVFGTTGMGEEVVDSTGKIVIDLDRDTQLLNDLYHFLKNDGYWEEIVIYTQNSHEIHQSE